MEGSRFDSLTRRVGAASTRRTTLHTALGAVVASTVAVAGLATLGGEAAAKNKNNKKKNKQRTLCKQRLRQLKCTPLPERSVCATNEQCCTNQTNRFCALGPGTGSTTICCRGTGGGCNFTSDCCRHFTCVAGVCRM